MIASDVGRSQVVSGGRPLARTPSPVVVTAITTGQIDASRR